MRLENAKNLVTGDEANLGDTVRVAESDTDLRGSETLPGELGDVLDDVLGGGLQPGRRGAAVGEGRGRNALAGSVHATHDGSEQRISIVPDGDKGDRDVGNAQIFGGRGSLEGVLSSSSVPLGAGVSNCLRSRPRERLCGG